MDNSIAARLDRYLLKSADNGCWEWIGNKRNGYGRIYCGEMGLKSAHRIAWELRFGPLTDGIKVLHRCDNPSCCNPDHLFLGSQIDNIYDMVKKGRQYRPRGTKNPKAKLTEGMVAVIKRLRGLLPLTVIAEAYGIHHSTVKNVCSGRTWKIQ